MEEEEAPERRGNPAAAAAGISGCYESVSYTYSIHIST